MGTFQVIMVLTFLGAIISLFLGVFNLGSTKADGQRSTKLMFMRLAFSIALLFEIIVYIAIH